MAALSNTRHRKPHPPDHRPKGLTPQHIGKAGQTSRYRLSTTINQDRNQPLDYEEDTWLRRRVVNDTRSRALLLYARRAVADLAEAGGWEAEYPRDVWRMHRLGFDGRRSLRFGGIEQPWLRDLAKRWV